MAAVEVHGRESLRFLIGHVDRQFIGGRTGSASTNSPLAGGRRTP